MQILSTRRDVMRVARERGVRYVRLGFVDVLGIEKSVTVPIAQLERALEGTIAFDGGSIDGFARGVEVDMVLKPDPATFTILPWTLDGLVEARMLCDIAMADGTPFEGCPRTTLKRVIEDAADVLTNVTTAMEVEFYLFDCDRHGDPTTHTSDAGSYFDFNASDRGTEARTAMVGALEAMGIGIASAHHEHGAGQHELDLSPATILASADHFVTVRGVVKTIAARHQSHATFMPKPLEASAGSGLHISVALPDADEETLLNAIGGIIEHAPGFTAVCNPIVNSYKRLVAAWDAPIYTVWSKRSANALVRVPEADGPNTIEIRSPDASCNPYLAYAAIVESIADGIRCRRLPGAPFVGSTYDLSERFRLEHGIRTLPTALNTALAELDADLVVRGALGDHIYHAFRDAKVAEYERYRRVVHAWEHDHYLRVY
jgi:glutamine synthetase